MSTALSLVFNDVHFDVVDRNGQPWLRGLQVASALGFKNPASDIKNLYDRNADEFTDAMTAVVRLKTAGGMQDVRIFSPRGCYLLGMFARTHISKEFRKWVLDVLEQHTAQSFDLATMTSAALRELAAKVEEVAALKAAVVTMQPKADFYDHVAGSEALFDRSDAAKLLRTGPKRLWAALRDWKIVQTSGTPYQKYYDLGYFRLVPVLVHKGQYSIPYQQTMVTGKGLAWLKALMDSQVMPCHALTPVRGAL